MFELFAGCLEKPLVFETLEEAKEKAKDLLAYDGVWTFNRKGQSWHAKDFGLVIIFKVETRKSLGVS